MENHESNIGKDGSGVGSCMGGRTGDPFIDRSKVRILLCDNDMKSSEEVFELLCKCSYQVTSVKSARQVIDALNAEGPDIDIILSEVDLPMKKGMKMLKYIMRHEDLKRIPVIMMSAQDEVSTVVKCLRLGAADYLVKPLRTNELLNLWTHMWRRRQMLGLAEKNIISYDFDLAASDPSDANTNSTTLFSDDTEDKSRKHVNPDICLQTNYEVETNYGDPSNNGPHIQIENEQRADKATLAHGQFFSYPKKCELKIGESSAFFTYVKSSMLKKIPARSFPQGVEPSDENSSLPALAPVGMTKSRFEQTENAPNGYQKEEASINNSPGDEFPSSTSFPDSTSMERSCTPPMSMEFSKCSDEGLSQTHIHPRNRAHFDNSVFSVHPSTYPYYMSQMMMASPHHMYQNNVSDGQHNHPTSSFSSTIIPQYNNHQNHHIQQCPPHMSGMQPFPYFHMGMCLQPQQVPHTTAQQWYPSAGHSSSTSDANPSGKVNRREAALMKFRQKRKERCFDKKIRYVNRKRLAERRPRVKGQFVRKVNGVNVDLNGDPSPGELEDVDDEDDDDEEDVNTALRGSSLDDVL